MVLYASPDLVLDEEELKPPQRSSRKSGAPLEIVVLEIDKENRRLSLGHKQLEENPWDVFETVFTEGSTHEGTITELHDKGAVRSAPIWR